SHHQRDAAREREDDQRPGEAGDAGGDLGVGAVVEQRRVAALAARGEVVVLGDPLEPVRRGRGERRSGGGQPDRERQREDREPLHAGTPRGRARTTSGRVDMTALTAATVITASPMPISVWTPSIAGSTVPSGTVPEIASSSAVAVAPAITASHAPTPETARN